MSIRGAGQELRAAVVGSGPAAVGALHGIFRKRPGAKITLFCIARPPQPPPACGDASPPALRTYYDGIYRKLKRQNGLRFPALKSRFGQTFPQHAPDGRKRFYRSEFFGGMTGFWGGTMVPFQREHFAKWPVSMEAMEPHYRDIAALVGISGRPDALSGCFPDAYVNRPSMRILRGVEALASLVNERGAQGDYRWQAGVNRIALETRPGTGNACVYCGECMAGCFAGSVYNAGDTVKAFMAEKNIPLVKGEVLSVDPGTRTLLVRTETGIETFSGFEKVFLCAGCLGTTKIVMRSLGLRDGPRLQDNAVFQFPILNFRRRGSDPSRNSYVGLAGLLLACAPRTAGGASSHVQVYPNFDYLWRNAVPELFWPLLRRFVAILRDRLLWARLYTESGAGYLYAVRLNEAGSLEFDCLARPDRRALGAVMKSLQGVLNRKGFFVPPVRPVLAKTSSHLAGTFPYGGALADVQPDGEVTPGVHICDSACFPESPPVSPTFTIMANARRMVTEALEKMAEKER
jgi:ferredoxin